MHLKKIYNGHFRRVPGSGEDGDFYVSEDSDKNISRTRKGEKEIVAEPEEKRGGAGYGIIDNIVYGAGLGIGAVGLAVALVSSTVLASTLLFSTYLCVSGCSRSEEEVAEIRYA